MSKAPFIFAKLAALYKELINRLNALSSAMFGVLSRGLRMAVTVGPNQSA